MIKIITDHPIAITSRDHLRPFGTKNDNSINLKFNQKLHSIKPSPISILDLGCAGGGMVKSFIDQGDLAVGIEGSDYSLKLQRAEWASIPEYLFTADITKSFQVMIDEQNKLFDVITAWEFLEHIEEKDLQLVFENIDNHLLVDGLVIVSVNTHDSFHHRTVKHREWWVNYIEKTNLELNTEVLQHFKSSDFVRSSEKTFHLILQKSTT